MTEAPFTNVDAQFLFDHGQSLLDENLVLAMRLLDIAKNLESLHTKALAVLEKGDFAAGVRTAHERLLARSNLPPVERTPHLAAMQAGVTVKKIPRGVSGLPPEPVYKSPKEKKALKGLEGIVLDFAALGLEPKK